MFNNVKNYYGMSLREVPFLNDEIIELSLRENYICHVNKLPKSLKVLYLLNNPLKSIEGIWNCNNLEYIEFSQRELYDEIKLYCKITGCKFDFKDRNGRILSMFINNKIVLVNE